MRPRTPRRSAAANQSTAGVGAGGRGGAVNPKGLIATISPHPPHPQSDQDFLRRGGFNFCCVSLIRNNNKHKNLRLLFFMKLLKSTSYPLLKEQATLYFILFYFQLILFKLQLFSNSSNLLHYFILLFNK